LKDGDSDNFDNGQRSSSAGELRDTQDQLDTVLSLSPAGIYMTDADGKCIFVNRSWCEMTGLSEEETLGDGWVKALHPDDRARVFSSWEEMVKSGGIWENEYRYITPDGEAVWVYGKATGITDATGKVKGYVGSTVDITRRKRIEEELLESQLVAKSQLEELESIYDNTPVGLSYVDTDLP
jgi:PAS domain S-box-containing protein